MRMDDRQLYGLFAINRHPDGSPNLSNPFSGENLTPGGVFKKFLWMQGITDPVKQDELWKVEKKIRADLRRSHEREAGTPFGGVDGTVPPHAE